MLLKNIVLPDGSHIEREPFGSVFARGVNLSTTTLNSISEATGIPMRTLARYVAGTENPTPEIAEILLKAVGVTYQIHYS